MPSSALLHLPSFLLAYTPFVTPLPIWDYWPWLLIPLCVGVSVVYKSIKCRSMRTVPREALVILVWILIGMAAAAGALAGMVKVVEAAGN
jgi:hypothetical protein